MIHTPGPDGYVLSATNNIQADTPPENLCAMPEAATRHALSQEAYQRGTANNLKATCPQPPQATPTSTHPTCRNR